jgi:hypothetical protein
LLGAVLLLGACTHDMRILNAKEYVLEATASRSLRIAVEAETTGDDTQVLVDAVKEGLAAHSSVERVVYANAAPPDFEPHIIVHVKPTTSYEGSGWNYPITFPGFLVFTHAWNGYVYKANVSTELALRSVGSSEPFARQTVDTRWNLRHCDFERGAWNSSGWYTPFYGGLNLFIGFFMIPYDEDATPDFTREARMPYGRFIAAKVVELAGTQPLEPEPAPAEPAAAPPEPAPVPSPSPAP